MVISMAGRKMRKSFSARPASKPCITDFMNLLRIKKRQLIGPFNVMKNETMLGKKRTHSSIMTFKNGATFSIPSMVARDCTKAIGMMKKKVRKKKAICITNLFTVKETYGIARFGQYISRGSGAHSVSQSVGFRVCWV